MKPSWIFYYIFASPALPDITSPAQRRAESASKCEWEGQRHTETDRQTGRRWRRERQWETEMGGERGKWRAEQRLPGFPSRYIKMDKLTGESIGLQKSYKRLRWKGRRETQEAKLKKWTGRNSGVARWGQGGRFTPGDTILGVTPIRNFYIWIYIILMIYLKIIVLSKHALVN